jgi:hypothetical protein
VTLVVAVFLQENCFAIIVCIQLRMPLILVGPVSLSVCGTMDSRGRLTMSPVCAAQPGSSKTLSFQIVQNFLNDAVVHSHPNGGGSFFKGFSSIEASVFHYQASELTTSKCVHVNGGVDGLWMMTVLLPRSWCAARSARCSIVPSNASLRMSDCLRSAVS